MSIGEIAHYLVNTPGIGGAIVMAVVVAALTTYFFLGRWILNGSKKDREEV